MATTVPTYFARFSTRLQTVQLLTGLNSYMHTERTHHKRAQELHNKFGHHPCLNISRLRKTTEDEARSRSRVNRCIKSRLVLLVPLTCTQVCVRTFLDKHQQRHKLLWCSGCLAFSKSLYIYTCPLLFIIVFTSQFPLQQSKRCRGQTTFLNRHNIAR